jgi:hypothetical protein
MARTVRYTDRLKEYMAKKGHSHIMIELVDTKTCCSGFSEITAHFISDKTLTRIEKDICNRFDGEVGDVVVTARGLEYDDEITFDLKSFVGLKDIEIKGIRAWSL